MITKCRLKDAHSNIIAALTRLLDKPGYKRPYVVVTDAVTEHFVQFAGSRDEPLTFDVPQLALSEHIDKAPLAGADAAMGVLRRNFELPDEALLVIEEDEQTPHVS